MPVRELCAVLHRSNWLCCPDGWSSPNAGSVRIRIVVRPAFEDGEEASRSNLLRRCAEASIRPQGRVAHPGSLSGLVRSGRARAVRASER